MNKRKYADFHLSGAQGKRRRTPKLIHSHEESSVIAYLLNAFKQETTVDTIFECQKRGDDHMLIDGVLCFNFDDNTCCKLGVEYDGGHPFAHTEERLKHDIIKSIRVLESHPDMLLLRIRQNSAPMYTKKIHPRCIVIESATSKPHMVIRDVARALYMAEKWTLPVKLRQCMQNVASVPSKKCKCVDLVLDDLRLIINNARQEAHSKLEELVGNECAMQMMKCHGLLARIDAICDAIPILQSKYKITSLQTFMCGGVAAKFDDPEALYAILDKLQSKYKITSLQTLYPMAVVLQKWNYLWGLT